MVDLPTLSWEEKIDIALVYGGGLLLGVGSIVLRIQAGRPTGGLGQSVFELQYALGYPFLGAILLFGTRIRTAGGAFLATGTSLAIFVGLLLPAYGVELIDIASYTLLAGVVLFGGILHYRINRPTNAQVIVLVGLFIVEFWLYGVIYTVLAFRQVGEPLLLLGTLILTVILYGVGRILIREYANSYSDTFDSLLDEGITSN